MIAWTVAAFLIAGFIWSQIHARDRKRDADHRLAARRRIRAAKPPAEP